MIDFKNQFPILNRKINGKNLAYLDNASTTQKPLCVIEAITNYYTNHNANIHRGIHTLSEESTAQYEESRELTAKFLNAKSSKEIIFTRNTTESINLVAQTWGKSNIKKNDTIIVTALEHHANLIPWQELAKQNKAKLEFLELDENFLPILPEKFPENTKLIAITGMSNTIGIIPDLTKIIQKTKEIGAKILIDAAQLAAHQKIDLQKLDCDFLALSSHKLLGPTGVGVLYAKQEILENMPPYQVGGGMISLVEDKNSTWTEIPEKFEAGTPNIAGVIGFKAALEFIEEIGLEKIAKHEQKLIKQAITELKKIPEITLHIPKNNEHKSSLLSFTLNCTHPHDIASILNSEGVAIRAGHHCCQPLMRRLKVPATARISTQIYNTEQDIEQFIQAVKKVITIFG